MTEEAPTAATRSAGSTSCAPNVGAVPTDDSPMVCWRCGAPVPPQPRTDAPA